MPGLAPGISFWPLRRRIRGDERRLLRSGDSALHMREHGGGRPAVHLEPALLLILAERGAGQHAGLAVDLVAIDAECGELALHRLDLRRLELRVLAPGMLERLSPADQIGEMA